MNEEYMKALESSLDQHGKLIINGFPASIETAPAGRLDTLFERDNEGVTFSLPHGQTAPLIEDALAAPHLGFCRVLVGTARCMAEAHSWAEAFLQSGRLLLSEPSEPWWARNGGRLTLWATDFLRGQWGDEVSFYLSSPFGSGGSRPMAKRGNAAIDIIGLIVGSCIVSLEGECLVSDQAPVHSQRAFSSRVKEVLRSRAQL